MPTLVKHRGNKGMTLVEIILVATIIGILCAIAIPNFNRMRTNVYRDQCITNLRRIATAKEHWSLETSALDTATPTAAQLDPYIKDGTSSLTCPLDSNESFATSYTINNMSTDPACQIEGTHVLP